MRIGLINQLHGRPGTDRPPPSWMSIMERAVTAEAVGFDVFVFEDALLYRNETGSDGVWESFTIAAALAASTTRINLGQSVINSPYRAPALTAKIAETLDEISAGRYVLGIGAGNTPDSDYEAFGFPTDLRYSRFAEGIQIIHSLLKTGACDFAGRFYNVNRAELVLRGPRMSGPPIIIAAGSPKMLRLTAEFGDGWNWWAWDETLDGIAAMAKGLMRQLDAEADAIGRDPAAIDRTFDIYTVVPGDCDREGLQMEHPITGTTNDIAEQLLEVGELGFVEVRCDLWPKTIGAIESMAGVVHLVHEG